MNYFFLFHVIVAKNLFLPLFLPVSSKNDSIDVFHFISFKDHAEKKPIKSIVADICDAEAIEEVFVNVDVVFHCAALINFQYPPKINELERVNVNGKWN